MVIILTFMTVATDRPPVNMSETDPRPPSQLESYTQKPATASPATAKSSASPLPASEPVPGPEGSVEQLEEEAGQEGAFNPETGEINWDCPCLGGMAHGPCGEQFKAAFSCFIFSKEEPKGVDCVDHFRVMQKCFMEVSSELLLQKQSQSHTAQGVRLTCLIAS